MLYTDYLLLVGNFICALGTIRLILGVLKNKDILQGYDFVGSSLTFTAMCLFNIFYYMYNQWFTLAFGAVTLIYWGAVVIYKIKFGKIKQ